MYQFKITLQAKNAIFAEHASPKGNLMGFIKGSLYIIDSVF